MDLYKNADKQRERIFSDSIKAGEVVTDTPFLLKSVGKNQNVILADSHGNIAGKVPQGVDLGSLVGCVVSISGIGWMSEDDVEKNIIKVNKIEKSSRYNVMDVFDGLSAEQISAHWNVLTSYRKQLHGPHAIAYGMLLDAALFNNPTARKAFEDRPATLTRQANYRGGLLQETVTILRMAVSAAISYRKAGGIYMSEPDWELMVVGAILHGYGHIYYYTPYPSVKTQEGVLNGYTGLLKIKLKELIVEADIPIDDYELGVLFSTVANCCENVDRSAKPSTKEGRFLGHIYDAFVDNDLDNQAILNHVPCPADSAGYFFNEQTSNYIMLDCKKEEIDGRK